MRQNTEHFRQTEDFIVNCYNTAEINREPHTEKELLLVYQKYTVPLYDYIRYIYYFAFPISNEIRAMLGHLSEYRTSDEVKRLELHNAYGHFRRANLDALKIVCDEMDKSLQMILRKQYSYDYRNVYENYLKEFSGMYFEAKNAYLEAQEKECVGSDRKKHNIFEFYYVAAKRYILLKQFYDKYKKETAKIERRTILKKSICWCGGIFGTVVGILQLFS